VGPVAFSPDDSVIVVGSGNGSLIFFDSTTGELKANKNSYSGSVSSLDFSPVPGRLASGHFYGTVWLWNLDAQGLPLNRP
jgi:WD40 repeat protein